MDSDFAHLLRMHDVAAPLGSGLKPELYDLLVRNRPEPSETVRPLGAPQASSGPATHNLSADELDARGVTRIGQAPHSTTAKDGTDG